MELLLTTLIRDNLPHCSSISNRSPTKRVPPSSRDRKPRDTGLSLAALFVTSLPVVTSPPGLRCSEPRA
ncbi:hypothetical protein ACOMHN_002244 [Nucella lapillus]